MPEISLESQIDPFLEFSGRSVWLPRGMVVIPFGVPASPRMFLGGIFQKLA